MDAIFKISGFNALEMTDMHECPRRLEAAKGRLSRLKHGELLMRALILKGGYSRLEEIY